MNIDEFIEKVNEHDGMRAVKTDDGITVGTLRNNGIFIIPEDATNFLEIETWATSNRLYWEKPDRERLSSLIEEFLHTPVKERFPEKKYRLRFLDSDDGIDNDFMGPETYLGRTKNNCSGWYWATFQKQGAEIFTEKQLKELEKKNPKFAPAIEAMKEEAKDDEK